MTRRDHCLICGNMVCDYSPRCSSCGRSICNSPCLVEYAPETASILEELNLIIMHDVPIRSIAHCNDLIKRTRDLYADTMRTSIDIDKILLCIYDSTSLHHYIDQDEITVQREWLEEHYQEIWDNFACHKCIAEWKNDDEISALKELCAELEKKCSNYEKQINTLEQKVENLIKTT